MKEKFYYSQVQNENEESKCSLLRSLWNPEKLCGHQFLGGKMLLESFWWRNGKRSLYGGVHSTERRNGQ